MTSYFGQYYGSESLWDSPLELTITAENNKVKFVYSIGNDPYVGHMELVDIDILDAFRWYLKWTENGPPHW